MQNPNSLFNEAFYLMNSNALENNTEDFYTLIHTKPNFNKNRRLSFKENSTDYKTAIVLFEQFLILKPNCKFAHNYAGIAKVKIKDYEGAITDFTKVISIDPKYANAYNNRANVRFILKEYEEAIIDSSKAIALNKNNSDFYEIRGASKKSINDFKGAIKDFTKCIQLTPSNYKVYRLRAFAFYEIKNYEKAIEDFNAVYDNDFENFRAYLSRGKSYFELKNYKNAIEDLAIVVAEDSSIKSINRMLKEAKIRLHIEEQTLLEAGMSSKKPLIIEAIATMNNSLLEVLLDDYKIYQDAPKETFIEKINGIFEEFKEQKDTALIPFKGKCNGKGCGNKGCMGFSFVGNVSKMHLDLIFEETENNFKDIYDCTRFKADKKIKGLKEKRSIDIEHDEKAAFNKSPEYQFKANGAVAAFSEISTTPPQLLDFDQLSYWVDKYAILSKRIGEYDFFQPKMKWTSFTCLYSDLKEIKDYLDTNFQQIHVSYKQFSHLATEQDCIDWILKFETIYEQAPFHLKYNSTLEEGLVNCCINIKTKILFCGEEFIETYHFLDIYETKNRELLQKYFVYTDEEFQTKFNDRNIKNIQNDLFRLQYHIREREALAKIGTEIPFYLIKNGI
jgi:tetratricopeptide (TPR) repeat protein